VWFFLIQTMGSAKKPTGGKAAAKAPSEALSGAAARKARQQSAQRQDKRSTFQLRLAEKYSINNIIFMRRRVVAVAEKCPFFCYQEQDM